MHVKILFPRLDCSFKKGPVPKKVGPPNNPVRQHFLTFLNSLQIAARELGHSTEVVTLPLWQFDESHTKNCDTVLIPHKQRYQFDIPHAQYYMQMGFPDLFSIDSMGWCADSSIHPIEVESTVPGEVSWDTYVLLKDNNISKFSQPTVLMEESKLPLEYILFACQIPHDEVIKNHSTVSVEEALIHTLEWGKLSNIPVVVKPHPMNMAAMAPLQKLFLSERSQQDMWVDNISIHQALKYCSALFSVNSGGTGLEAVLHKKPIFRYGQADYNSISWDANNLDPSIWRSKDTYVQYYENWINTYISKHYVSYKPKSFYKLFRNLK